MREDVFRQDPANPVSNELKRVRLEIRPNRTFKLTDLTLPRTGRVELAGEGRARLIVLEVLNKAVQEPGEAQPIQLRLNAEGGLEYLDSANGMVSSVELRRINPSGGLSEAGTE
jgi:hypothetical protein